MPYAAYSDASASQRSAVSFSSRYPASISLPTAGHDFRNHGDIVAGLEIVHAGVDEIGAHLEGEIEAFPWFDPARSQDLERDPGFAHRLH